MSGVEYDETHSAEDVLTDSLYDLVRDFVVSGVSPPRKHVRFFEYVLAEPVLGFVQRGRFHVESF